MFFSHMVNVVRSAGPEWTDVEPGQARAFPHPPDRDARQVHSLSAVEGARSTPESRITRSR